MTIDFQAWQQGYEQFRQRYAHGDTSLMHDLSVNGQKPQTMVITCSDSRVDPALILGAKPGDLFVVRNVANLVPPYVDANACTSVGAALEYAVCYLHIKQLVIMGHSQCGGIGARLQPNTLHQDDCISNWMASFNPESQTDCDACAKQSVLNSSQNCMSYPWLKKQVDAGELEILRWFFKMDTAELEYYDDKVEAYIAV